MTTKIQCRNYTGQECRYAQMKLDGQWLEIRGKQALTSLPSDITHQVERYPWWLTLPEGISVYGELWCPDQPASYVKSALAKQLPLTYSPFACSWLSANASLELVECVLLKCCHLWKPPPWFLAADLPKILVSNQEGWVFKDGNRLNWYKWKPVKTLEAIVTGFVDGSGKYLGLTGALIVSVYRGTELVPVANVSGMTDETRIYISDNEESYLGRVVEVAYQYVGSKGRLRHPRFIRFRDDKAPEDCTWDQL